MPIYPPRNEPTKKVEILDRKIKELKRYIVGDFSKEKILNAVEKVRIAHLNVLKARLTLNSPYKKEDDTKDLQLLREKIQKDMANWEEIEANKIIDYYK
ncbi:hypothetical protein [Flagellimonas sp. S3867]|uniref:hypothetical protein n=1 Tax=Flagellimonas sp. S3867 TaxID=2768063 RepID=UPI0016894722|nr:hypothetical protein [Flagellimonas sp. S3867]